MTKIMMHGCNGVMGQVITKIVEETDDAVMQQEWTAGMMDTMIIRFIQICLTAKKMWM